MGLSSTHAMVTQGGGFIAFVHPCWRTKRALELSMCSCLAPSPRGEGDTVQPAASESGGETILLVEDEPLVRELSRDMLERQGYRVVLAADAKEAERMSAECRQLRPVDHRRNHAKHYGQRTRAQNPRLPSRIESPLHLQLCE